MEKKLVDEIKLENGQALLLFDRSRPVAGDRWLITFEAYMEVEVKPAYLEGEMSMDVSFDTILSVTGEKVVYSYEKERKFIPENERDAVFDELKNSFLDANLGYLSGPDVPGKVIMREYRKIQKSSAWKS